MAESVVVVVELDGPTVEHLQDLIGPGWQFPAEDLSGLAYFLLRHASDGVRRPGSWERGWIQQATGLPS